MHLWPAISVTSITVGICELMWVCLVFFFGYNSIAARSGNIITNWLETIRGYEFMNLNFRHCIRITTKQLQNTNARKWRSSVYVILCMMMMLTIIIIKDDDVRLARLDDQGGHRVNVVGNGTWFSWHLSSSIMTHSTEYFSLHRLVLSCPHDPILSVTATILHRHTNIHLISRYCQLSVVVD